MSVDRGDIVTLVFWREGDEYEFTQITACAVPSIGDRISVDDFDIGTEAVHTLDGKVVDVTWSICRRSKGKGNWPREERWVAITIRPNTQNRESSDWGAE